MNDSTCRRNIVWECMWGNFSQGIPFVKVISFPATRSCSALRYSSPRTAYCVFFTFSLMRSGWRTLPSLELTGTLAANRSCCAQRAVGREVAGGASAAAACRARLSREEERRRAMAVMVVEVCEQILPLLF